MPHPNHPKNPPKTPPPNPPKTPPKTPQNPSPNLPPHPPQNTRVTDTIQAARTTTDPETPAKNPRFFAQRKRTSTARNTGKSRKNVRRCAVSGVRGNNNNDDDDDDDDDGDDDDDHNNNRASGRHSGQQQQPLGHRQCAKPYNFYEHDNVI